MIRTRGKGHTIPQLEQTSFVHGPSLVPRCLRVEAGEGVLVEDDLALDDPVVEAEVGDGQLDEILLARVLALSVLSRRRRRRRGGRS